MLNRFDPRAVPGLADVSVYASMVQGGDATGGEEHMRFRVLVPVVARVFYQATKSHLRTWDPVLFGLLMADALFTAATATLIVRVGADVLPDRWAAPVLGAFVYLVNFAVANLRLTGLVDAGEGFFVMAIAWNLIEHTFWLLPVWFILGTLTKESFLALGSVTITAWWLCSGRRSWGRGQIGWAAASVAAGFLTLALVQWRVQGHFTSPLKFAIELHGNTRYVSHAASSLVDRNLWYIFFWLLPASLPNVRRLPAEWVISTAAAACTALILDTYYGGAPGTLGRVLFTVAGPVLSLSAAILLIGVGTQGEPTPADS